MPRRIANPTLLLLVAGVLSVFAADPGLEFAAAWCDAVKISGAPRKWSQAPPPLVLERGRFGVESYRPCVFLDRKGREHVEYVLTVPIPRMASFQDRRCAFLRGALRVIYARLHYSEPAFRVANPDLEGWRGGVIAANRPVCSN